MKKFLFLLFFMIASIPNVLLSQLEPHQKHYFAKSGLNSKDTIFYVMGLFLDSIEAKADTTKSQLQYVPEGKFHNWPVPDTIVHPFGRQVLFLTSGQIYCINQYFDTIPIPDYSDTNDISFNFKHQSRYFMRKSNAQRIKLLESQLDSIAYWDLYIDSAGQQILKCQEWIGIGQKCGLYLFHNMNRPDSTGSFYFRLPYRKADARRIWNYQPGDWLEYTYWCSGFGNPSGPYLDGPVDYMLIEILHRYNDSQYRVKTTFKNRIPGQMTILEDTTITLVEKSTELCNCDLRLLYGIDDLAPGNLYGSSMYYSPHDVYYDTLENRFHYSNNHYETPSFEPRYDGSYSIENIGALRVYYSNSQSLTTMCKSLTGVHIAGVLDYGFSHVGLRVPVPPIVASFPNPATNFIQIQGIKTEVIDIDIYSMNGKLIMQVKDPNEGKIDISSLSDGIYFITLRTPYSGRIKFIKLTR